MRRMLSLLLLLGLMALPATVWGPVASAAIVQGGLTTAVNAQSGSGTLTIPKHADVVSGDFLLAQITFEKGSDINNLVAPSADWKLVRRTNFSSDIGQAILYKVATGSEPASYTWGFKKGSSFEQVRAAGGITRYTGVNVFHPDGPIVGSSGGSGDGTVLTAPSINAVTNSMVVGFFGHKKRTTLSVPSGMTNLYQQQHSNQSGPTIRAAQELRTSDGATGTRVSNADAKVGGDKWVAQLVALRGNTVPVYTPPASQESNEGEDKAFALGSFVDPDLHPSWEITVEWGDDSPAETFSVTAAGSLGTRNHTYADNLPAEAPYTVTVTVDDGFDTDSDTFQVTVRNVTPAVDAGADATIDEGGTFSSSGSFIDPGADTWTATVDYGDGSGVQALALAADKTFTLSNTYADNGFYTVTVTVTDDDLATGSDTAQVTVLNKPPVVTAPADQTASEGASTSFSLGSFTDPGVNDSPWTVGVDWGDTSSEALPSASAQGSLGSANHTYADNGTYTVTVTVTDKDGAPGTATFGVTVSNEPPVVTAPADQTASEGTAATLSLGSFSDLGLGDGPWTVGVDWGDTFTDALPNATAQGSLGSADHTYDDDGTYPVTVTVTDKDGDTGSATFDVVVGNVAPTATFTFPASVNAGTSFTLSLGAPQDPSGADTTAGFDYAFDCGDGSGYGAFGSTASRSCATSVAGTRNVKGQVRDKDGGTTEYTGTVTVNSAGFTFYLHNNPIRTNTACGNTTSQANLPLDATAPVATILCNYDTDRDAFPGRLIQKGGSGATETDMTKIQTWRATAPAGGLALSGNVQLTFFSGMKDFTSGSNLTIRGFVRAFLRDCPASGSCTLIASSSLDQASWHGGVNQWMQKTITFTGVGYTVPATRRLEVKLVVDGNAANDMWFAYDTTAHPSRLIVP